MLAAPVAGLTGIAGSAHAQVVLGQTLDYDGHWAIDYPDGWVVNISGFPVLASIPSALGTLLMNDPLPTNSLAMGIMPPDVGAMLGVLPGMSLAEAAARVASFYAVGEVVTAPFETTAGPAISAALGASVRLPGGSTIVVLDRAGAIFVFLVVVGDFAAATPLIQQMLATLR